MQFKDIVGQRDVINRLTEIIDSGRVSHAQMIVGSAAAGSMAIAWAYLQYLNCTDRHHHDSGDLRADSCGQCPSCKKISQLVHPDLFFYFPHDISLDGKSTDCGSSMLQPQFRQFLKDRAGMGSLEEWHTTMGLEKKNTEIRAHDARYMIRSLELKPYEGGWRMAVVWMPERLGTAAANELLKTLEEPQPRTLLLLVGEHFDELLPTIRSRVQTVRLHHVEQPIPDDQRQAMGQTLVGWLRMLFKLKMKELSKQVDEMDAMNREQKQQFLRFAQGVVQRCLEQNITGQSAPIGTGDAKFDASFPAMVTPNNAEALLQALDDAIFAIGRNANGKITLMQTSFRLSKALKKR